MSKWLLDPVGGFAGEFWDLGSGTRPSTSARGAASIVREAVTIARDTGCGGMLIVRMDSAFYCSPGLLGSPQSGRVLFGHRTAWP